MRIARLSQPRPLRIVPVEPESETSRSSLHDSDGVQGFLASHLNLQIIRRTTDLGGYKLSSLQVAHSNRDRRAGSRSQLLPVLLEQARDGLAVEGLGQIRPWRPSK